MATTNSITLDDFRALVIKENEYVDREMSSVSMDMDMEYCKKHGALQENSEVDSLTIDLCTTAINKRMYALLNNDKAAI